MRPECSWPRWKSDDRAARLAESGRPVAIEELDAVMRAKRLLEDRASGRLGRWCSLQHGPTTFPCSGCMQYTNSVSEGFRAKERMFHGTQTGVMDEVRGQRVRSAAGRRGSGRARRARLGSGRRGPVRRRRPRRRGDRHLEGRAHHARPLRSGRSRGAGALRRGTPLGALADILENTPREGRDATKPWLLAPIDLQAVKAAGVTFVVSMLERVIEEQARGEAARANEVRAEIQATIGDDLRKLKPGSEQAKALKELLIRRKVWSQYLEVGIGPDAEVFTKAQPMSAVGHLAEAGPQSDVVVEQSRAGGRAGRVERAARSSARRSATTSTSATSRGARRCFSARPRTTMRAPRSGRSSGSSTRTFRSTMCARRSFA